MSNPLAIATVTATLRNLLLQGFSSDGFGDNVRVTTQPLDKARDDNTPQSSQINLFLYQTQINAAWRNCDMPGQISSGETGFSPLPLNLYYLLTAYGPDEDVELIDHQLLGRAMSILHDNPFLDKEQIENALPDTDLHRQLERVRITSYPMSLEDLSKLWTTFQTQYRTSASYEVSVVLIESKRPTRAPLPVLQRGRRDQGVDTLTSPAPVLRQVRTSDQTSQDPPRPAVELGSRLVLLGEQLNRGDTLTVQFQHPLIASPLQLTPLPERKPTELEVQLPNPADTPNIASEWLAGFFTVSLLVQEQSLPNLPDFPTWTTNAIPLAIAPRITITEPPLPPPPQPGDPTPEPIPTAPQGDVDITLTCIPRIRPEQRVMLVFGNQQLSPTNISTPNNSNQPTTLNFLVEDAKPGTYVVRLRVDGVDSIPIDFTSRPPQFANDQKVIINE